jgi:hypothetical protein
MNWDKVREWVQAVGIVFIPIAVAIMGAVVANSNATPAGRITEEEYNTAVDIAAREEWERKREAPRGPVSASTNRIVLSKNGTLIPPGCRSCVIRDPSATFSRGDPLQRIAAARAMVALRDSILAATEAAATDAPALLAIPRLTLRH